MTPQSELLIPPRTLAGCIAAGIWRDTRGALLPETDRFNCFPASPLVAVTRILAGELRLVRKLGDVCAAETAKPLADLTVTLPSDEPVMSWSPGPVTAITIGFYPDAWQNLGGSLETAGLPRSFERALAAFDADKLIGDAWTRCCKDLEILWAQAREKNAAPAWAGSHRLVDWSRHLATRLAVTAPGRSARTLERRFRRWTGQTRQAVNLYAAVEALHERSVKADGTSLAVLASDAGFADQSHMGRAVRRTTGFSPARLNKLIDTHEAFWCYRLLGERF